MLVFTPNSVPDDGWSVMPSVFEVPVGPMVVSFVAGSKSALVTTAMSGTSAIPAFMYCRLSPAPGWMQSRTRSVTWESSLRC